MRGKGGSNDFSEKEWTDVGPSSSFSEGEMVIGQTGKSCCLGTKTYL